MPSNINIQLAEFQQFVQFAETAIAAGKQKAIARVETSEVGGIANRTIVPGSGDWVGIGVGRLSSLKKANNTTRATFLKAVSDMFGGQDHIPESVQAAMKMEDYGKGKPLTARRIMAVKEAIVQALTENEKANTELKDAMTSLDPISKSGLPEEFARELRPILNDLHVRFFGVAPANEPSPRQFGGGDVANVMENLVKTANAQGRRVTVEEVVSAMKPLYERGVAAEALKGPLGDIASEYGQDKVNPFTIFKARPEILDDLRKCDSPDDVRLCFEKHKESIKEILKLRGELEKYQKEFISMVEKAINEGTGRNDFRFDFSDRSLHRSAFMSKIRDYSSSILQNENEDAKQTGWTLEAGVKKLVDKIAGRFIARIKEIDKLVADGEIPEKIGKMWRDELTLSADAKGFSPAKIVAMSKKLNPQTLIDGFKPKNDTRTALKAISDFANQIEDVAVKEFGGREWKYDRGPEQRNAVKICILNVLFAKTPGLKEAIFSRKDEMKDSFQEMLTTYKTNARGSRESVKGPDYDLANVLFGDKCFDYLDMERP